jgi:hypothetical protein
MDRPAFMRALRARIESTPLPETGEPIKILIFEEAPAATMGRFLVRMKVADPRGDPSKWMVVAVGVHDPLAEGMAEGIALDVVRAVRRKCGYTAVTVT